MRKPTRFAVSCLAAACGLSAPRALLAAPPATRPNIVLIIADDLGYGDVSCYGEKDLPTPNIDAIAAAGVRFTAGYMASPVSSPSRAAMLTGRTPTRWGQEFNPEARIKFVPHNFGLPLSERTFADELKLAGYSTALVGKWHQGLRPEFHPTQRGFDEFFGFLHGSHSYYDSEEDPGNPILRGTRRVHESAYLTEAFTREAIDYISRHKDRPFCLVLAYNAPHVPNEPPPQKYLDRFKNETAPGRRVLCGMISALDDGVGQVMSELRQQQIEDNTLVIFVSDNGGAMSRNAPFIGGKGDLNEGGIRVPFLLQWKARIPAARVIDEPVSGMDIYSTILSAAQARPPAGRDIDGLDLLPPCLSRAKLPFHPCLAWHYADQFAIRLGNDKLLQTPRRSRRLVDLSTDLTERRDLSHRLPDLARLCQQTYEQWDRRNVPPAWPRPAPSSDHPLRDLRDQAEKSPLLDAMPTTSSRRRRQRLEMALAIGGVTLFSTLACALVVARLRRLGG